MASILVIDDDAAMRRLLSRVLGFAGHTVHAVADGRLGIKVFLEVHPELIITDIVMPNKEGIETIIELRRHDTSVPILAIGGGHPIYLRLATRAGSTAALEKPFGAHELLAVVTELLAATSKSRE